MKPTSAAACAALLVACGTGLDEGVAVAPTAPTQWQLSFDDAADLDGALAEYNCTGDEPISWRVADGHLSVSATCIPPAGTSEGKVLRASMIRFPSGLFGYGWLVARVRPSDDDTWGVVWGPERAYFRFSARNDAERATITLIATPGSDFAGRSHPDAPDKHRYLVLSTMPDLRLYFDTWTEVAIHRTPDRTTVYLGRDPTTWFVGDSGDSGPVGFYAARMDQLAIDDVAIYEPGPPPWERVASVPSE